jgi:hypothetical protein
MIRISGSAISGPSPHARLTEKSAAVTQTEAAISRAFGLPSLTSRLLKKGCRIYAL